MEVKHYESWKGFTTFFFFFFDGTIFCISLDFSLIFSHLLLFYLLILPKCLLFISKKIVFVCTAKIRRYCNLSQLEYFLEHFSGHFSSRRKQNKSELATPKLQIYTSLNCHTAVQIHIYPKAFQGLWTVLALLNPYRWVLFHLAIFCLPWYKGLLCFSDKEMQWHFRLLSFPSAEATVSRV